MNRNLNTNEISARLGHSNTSTTVNIYGHVLKTADQHEKTLFPYKSKKPVNHLVY